MNGEASWLYEVAVKPGEADGVRELMRQPVDSTRAEPGTLTYEWALSEDETVAHISERYARSAATLSHLAGFREKFAQRFLAAVDPVRLVIYGTPGDEVREALAASDPTFMTPLAGFDRRRAL